MLVLEETYVRYTIPDDSCLLSTWVKIRKSLNKDADFQYFLLTLGLSHKEVRGRQLMGIISFFAKCGYLELNSGIQAGWQVLLLTEPPFLIMNCSCLFVCGYFIEKKVRVTVQPMAIKMTIILHQGSKFLVNSQKRNKNHIKLQKECLI